MLDPPGSVAELNTRAAAWLATVVDVRPHRATGEPPERLRERPPLAPLPRVRYDTARREPRRVGRCHWSTSTAPATVPPELAGELVEVRLPVASTELQIRSAQLAARHTLAAAGQTARDPAHRAASSGWPLAAAGQPATCAPWPTRCRRAPPTSTSARATTRSPPPTLGCATTWTGVRAMTRAAAGQHSSQGLYEQLKDDLGYLAGPGGRAAARPARPGPR